MTNAFFCNTEIKSSDTTLSEVAKLKKDKLTSICDLDKPIAKELKEDDVPEKKAPIQNKIDGLRREAEVEVELKEKYPKKDGFSIVPEACLRDENGDIVKDPITGEARRIDFVVIKDGKVVDSIEVTSNTADKTTQSEKETRIRAAGGNFVKLADGTLAEIPANVTTKIIRKE